MRTEAIPRLLFIERAATAEPVNVEVDRPRAVHPKVTGIWRDGAFSRVRKIVETRFEYGAMYLRVVTDHGCVDLRRHRVSDPRTLKMRTAWEICADLDAVEITMR